MRNKKVIIVEILSHYLDKVFHLNDLQAVFLFHHTGRNECPQLMRYW